MKTALYKLATDQSDGPLDPLFKSGLLLLSKAYGWGSGCVRTSQRRKAYRLPVPVISIGNLTLGGSGKTPLTIKIASELKAAGIQPAILSRGYFGEDRGQGLMNDETAMLTKLLMDVPVLVGKNRIQTAEQFLSSHMADVFLMDDGFQHWKLHRDCDIVAVDCTNPFGNGELIPRGILREPIRALNRAGMIVLTRTDQGADRIERILSTLDRNGIARDKVFLAVHQPLSFEDLKTGETLPLDALAGQKALVVSSIGNPESFVRTVRDLSVNVAKIINYPDHFLYDKENGREMSRACVEENLRLIVTTQKDAVKWQPLMKVFDPTVRFAALNMELRITERNDEFLKRIHSVLQL